MYIAGTAIVLHAEQMIATKTDTNDKQRVNRKIELEPAQLHASSWSSQSFYYHATHMHSAVYATARCLSVCLSVTRRCSIETAKQIELFFLAQRLYPGLILFFSGVPVMDCCRVDNTLPKRAVVGLPILCLREFGYLQN